MRTLISVVLFMLILAAPGISEITIQLTEGDNLISINVIPPDEMYRNEDDPGPDFILMFEQIQDHVLMVRDNSGRFYNPEMGFSNLGFWDLTKAYLVNVDEDIEVTWEGEQIPADADVPLNQGENWIAYYPQYELDASAPDFYVLSPIIDFVERANDWVGGEMNPDEDFSNMEPWRPGRGYVVCVSEEVVLNYPAEPEGVSDMTEAPASYTLLHIYPNPFNSNATIRFTLPQAGPVTLAIYDPLGRKVQDLIPRVWMEAGEHCLLFEAPGSANGVYMIHLRQNGIEVSQPLILVK